MPTKTATHCCLTLTRSEWKLLDELLATSRHACAMPCRQAIRDELANNACERVGIDREWEKWATVHSTVHDESCRRGGAFNMLIREMGRQISAAAVQDW